MRATTTTLENNRVKLVVEVDDSEMETAIDAAAKKLSQQVSIKGFRKGKVPKNVLMAHIGGPTALRGEAIQSAIPDFYAHAVSDTLIDPIAQPEINITSGEEEGTLVFEADVEVRPELEITDYGDLRVTIPSPIVTDEEVDAQIDRFRETDAVLKDVDRPIVTGDLVTMDVHVEQHDSGAEPLDMSDYMYTVGSGSITEGVDDLILGLKAGEELKLNGTFGQGVVATYELTLKKIQERELPELNDEWVEENTEWENVGEMRDRIFDQMRRVRVAEAQRTQRDSVLVALSELVSADEIPEPLVQDETNERLHDLGHRLEQQKLNLDTFLQVTNQSPEQLLETLRADAARAVRIDLALRALVRAENLDPSDEEIDEELTTTAESMKVSADVLRTNLRDSGRVVTFRSEVAKMKASRWLNEHVTFIDPEGVEIDPSLLETNESDESDEVDA
ncbi:MAG TPA: trigger factor [Acidimicrobiales bacterium]|jgi:trigger factor|nr:trigger factor [Acidimicrobiales bacterium]